MVCSFDIYCNVRKHIAMCQLHEKIDFGYY